MSEGSAWLENLDGLSSLRASRIDSEGLGGAWGPHITSEELQMESEHRVRPLRPQRKTIWTTWW